MPDPAPAAFVDRSDRARLVVTGPDRAKFLHNLTTNEVKRLPAGRGCEAFVTSPQGKALGYVTLLAAEDSILLRADPGGLRLILPHFQKYGLFDDVAWEDSTAATFEYHVLGPETAPSAGRLGTFSTESGPELGHAEASIGGSPVRAIREAPFGREGITFIGRREDADAVAALIREGGLVNLDPDEAEVLRIEAGTPVFGKDVTEANLPQEVGRDDRAISFVKGCYLGQETVARLDALGHVNKVLRGLAVASDRPPPPGSAFEVDGKPVATVTSSAFSPRLGRAIALALVRATHARAGTELTGGGVGARVVELPFGGPG